MVFVTVMFLANSKRETYVGDPIPLNQVARLKQRCDWVNKLYRKDKSSYKRAVFYSCGQSQ